jgi:medium-chain acyl-[acyl-carrier-protein] hydrolase
MEDATSAHHPSFFCFGLGKDIGAIHKMPDAEFRAQLREFAGTPDAVLRDAELMELPTPILRADFAVCESYSYTAEEPLDRSITAFGGSNDPKVSRDEMSAWRAQTTRSFSLRMFPGTRRRTNNSQEKRG